MKIVMMTNTYKPFVGGVERSVDLFARAYRDRGHDVLIVAPSFENTPTDEKNVVRVNAIQNFNGTDFSVPLPAPGILSKALKEFDPDIVHSHHPYLIGDTALRVSAKYKIPLVFTFHTLYERYTHYVPGDSPVLRRMVAALSAGYANLCDYVFAPSGSIKELLLKRGVKRPVEVIPTGINTEFLKSGNSREFRETYSIPQDAFVIGFVSRIAKEKNLFFLSKAVASLLKKITSAHFLIVGKGPLLNNLKEFFYKEGLGGRVHFTGVLEGEALVNAYHGMDVFVFTSRSETQGLVVTEAMAAGKPVIALDAFGVRDVVEDGYNGWLLATEKEEIFEYALERFMNLSSDERLRLGKNAFDTAGRYSIDRCVEKALIVYERMIKEGKHERMVQDSKWENTIRVIKAEWDVLVNMTKAAETALDKKKQKEFERGDLY